MTKIAAEIGMILPSQVSPALRANHTPIPETDVGNDSGGDTIELLPPSQRQRVILGLDYSATELADATTSGNAAHIQLGIASDSVALDVDAICDETIPYAIAVYSANHVNPEDCESTLKTSKENPGLPVVPVGYAVYATIVKNSGGGDNDGKVYGDLLWSYADDIHSV